MDVKLRVLIELLILYSLQFSVFYGVFEQTVDFLRFFLRNKSGLNMYTRLLKYVCFKLYCCAGAVIQNMIGYCIIRELCLWVL